MPCERLTKQQRVVKAIVSLLAILILPIVGVVALLSIVSVPSVFIDIKKKDNIMKGVDVYECIPVGENKYVVVDPQGIVKINVTDKPLSIDGKDKFYDHCRLKE